MNNTLDNIVIKNNLHVDIMDDKYTNIINNISADINGIYINDAANDNNSSINNSYDITYSKDNGHHGLLTELINFFIAPKESQINLSLMSTNSINNNYVVVSCNIDKQIIIEDYFDNNKITNGVDNNHLINENNINNNINNNIDNNIDNINNNPFVSSTTNNPFIEHIDNNISDETIKNIPNEIINNTTNNEHIINNPLEHSITLNNSQNEKIVISIDKEDSINIKINDQNISLAYNPNKKSYEINNSSYPTLYMTNASLSVNSLAESITSTTSTTSVNSSNNLYDSVSNARNFFECYNENISINNAVVCGDSIEISNDNSQELLSSSLNENSDMDDDNSIKNNRKKTTVVRRIGMIAISAVALVGGSWINKLFN